jgi:hypothetical protein
LMIGQNAQVCDVTPQSTTYEWWIPF